MIVDMKDTYLRVLRYLDSEMEDDEAFAWILRETAARGIPEIQITPVQGRFLRLLVQLLGARRILEIGTLSGYSAVWMAPALPPDGKLITLEANPRHAALARESFRRAGVAERIDMRVGPALDALRDLRLDAPLDMVFIDADKGNNRGYFEWALAHVRRGGLIVVDNVLVNGRVDLSGEAGAYCRSIAAFNAWVLERYRDQTTIIPFYKPDEDNLDGIMIVRVS